MGWSIDVVRIELNKIFREAGSKYRITRPQSSQQGVVIEYLRDDELPLRFKRRVVELFPDFIYVEFNVVQASQQVAEQMEWDN